MCSLNAEQRVVFIVHLLPPLFLPVAISFCTHSFIQQFSSGADPHIYASPQQCCSARIIPAESLTILPVFCSQAAWKLCGDVLCFNVCVFFSKWRAPQEISLSKQQLRMHMQWTQLGNETCLCSYYQSCCTTCALTHTVLCFLVPLSTVPRL